MDSYQPITDPRFLLPAPKSQPQSETDTLSLYLNDPKLWEEIIETKEGRLAVAETLIGFCLIYLPHYLQLTPADFHQDLIGLLDHDLIQFLSVIGFRGSAKSTFASLALPLQRALHTRNKFIIVFSDTTDQAKLNVANLRHELEDNELLKTDYGDMSEGVSKQREWTKSSLLLKNGVRLMGRSRGQRIRGLRHREQRPDLVIVDDPEELEKVQKKEYRDKTERWLRSELIPAIEESKARLIVVGNVLHNDALMARLKADNLFEHREYAIFKDGDGWEHCTWKGKYPTQAALDKQRGKVGITAWLREYCLKVVPPEGQEVKEEWLLYYDKLPEIKRDPETKLVIFNPFHRSGVGVDLAISKKQTADFTAMVAGVITVEEGTSKLYILPRPTNAHLSFYETIQTFKSMNAAVGTYALPMFFIEAVAYQIAAVQEALRHGIPAQEMRVGTDKRARLRAAALFIQDGTVLFPRKGAEDLITQLTGFGIEEHDDLTDAFVLLVLGLRSEGMTKPEVIELL